MSKKDPKLYREQQENVAIIGDQNISVPEELLLDTKQNFDDDARIWGYILKCARTGNDMPTQGEIAEAIGKSRPTVNLSIQMLRLNRWITVIEDERDKGRFTKLTYALHGYQMPIEATLQYDPGFTHFVQQQTTSSKKRVMQRAMEVLKAVEVYLEDHSIAPAIPDQSEDALPPCKDFLHGRHLSSTTSTSSTTTLPSTLDTFVSEFSATTGRSTEIDDSVTTGHKTEPETDQPDTDDPVTTGHKPNTYNLHKYFRQVPKSVHKTLINGFTKYELDPTNAAAVMRELVKRLNNHDLPTINVLPRYIESLLKKAAAGELYDSEAAVAETKQRRQQQADDHHEQALLRRGAVHGISPLDNESEAVFKKRVEQAEYVAQMKRYGVDVDPITGAVKN